MVAYSCFFLFEAMVHHTFLSVLFLHQNAECIFMGFLSGWFVLHCCFDVGTADFLFHCLLTCAQIIFRRVVP